MRPAHPPRSVRRVNWFERQVERCRSLPVALVDGAAALVFTVLGLVTVFMQDLRDGMDEPTALAVLTVAVTCLPLAVRRRAPLAALTASTLALLVHVLADFPEGALPVATVLLTYSVAAWSPLRDAVIGLVVYDATLVVLGLADTAGLDTAAVLGNLAFFGVAWALGIAVRARRESMESRVRELEERAKVERQSTARALAEQRLEIAQELHDVVAHSMSVIAVQAGVGAHVLDDRPDEARAALEAISATSRGALNEMRRLLSVLRDADGERSHQPAPGLADLAQLVADVRAVGVPVSLEMRGTSTGGNPAVELSAYRVVQEALTNVIKHAGTPSRVDVVVDRQPGSLTIEVVDDGRGAAAVQSANGTGLGDGSGHGLTGMRERIDVWGGELHCGPAPGGGYRVRAELPYGEPG
jgi:signal transduction histidine kinase